MSQAAVRLGTDAEASTIINKPTTLPSRLIAQAPRDARPEPSRLSLFVVVDHRVAACENPRTSQADIRLENGAASELLSA